MLTLMAAETIIKDTSVDEINVADVAMYRWYIKARIVGSCRSDPDRIAVTCRSAAIQKPRRSDGSNAISAIVCVTVLAFHWNVADQVDSFVWFARAASK